MTNLELEKTANEIRKSIVTAVHSAKSGHPGGSLSSADIFTYLYFEEMNIDPKNPKMEDRDRFVLSKGHVAPGLYSTLAERGYFPKEDLVTLRHTGSYLQGHPDMKHIPGVDMSSGSLGQGISAAVGMAIAGKLDNADYRVYTLLGDGEIQEGQVWEASMLAAHRKLDNLVVIVDNNNLQIDGAITEVNSPYPIDKKFEAFNFHVINIDANDLDEIVITLSIEEYGKLEKIVAKCEKCGIHTKFIPDYNNIIPTRAYIEDVQGLPVINIRRVPLSGLFNRFIKRFADIVLAVLALIIFSPIMLIVAVLVKTTSKGPVIYKQERVGLHNKTFKMYKFRSMIDSCDGSDKKKWTTQDDPRVTKVGKFIRKTSLDELPQFVNVIKGDMSIVGPRPERPYYVDKFKEEIPRYMIKHQVRPGITGWAQVNGYRGDTSIYKRIECDLYYIENWTVLFDIKILFFTVFKGFINKNAY